MANTSTIQIEDSIYPGELVQLRENSKEPKHLNKKIKKIPPINLSETDDSFELEIFLPGIKKENIIIEIIGNILSLITIKNEDNFFGNKKYKICEYECAPSERSIPLPKNADPSYLNAELREGVLRLKLSKSKNIENSVHTRVAVY